MIRKTNLITLIIFAISIFAFSSCNVDESNYQPKTKKASSKERLYMIKKVDKPLSKAVALNDKLWKPGDIIKIKFLNGSFVLQEKIKQYAAGWLEYANIKFQYVNASEEADVKIGFEHGDYFPSITWSTIGTDCKSVPQDEASLNFVWLEDEEDDDFFRSEVLRGFGHILGLGFEHRSPESPIIFKDPTKVTDIRRIEGFFGLTIDEIREHIMPLYEENQTSYSEYDAESIMLLPIPGTFLSNPRLGTIANIELSETDKLFIAELYPKIYLDKVEFGSQNPKFDLFSEVHEAPNGLLYNFNDCGITVINLNNRTAEPISYSFANSSCRVDDIVYFVQVNNGSIKKLDLVTGSISNTNLSTFSQFYAVKGADGITYFATREGLYYLDIDGVIKIKDLSSLGINYTKCMVNSMVNKEDGTIYLTAKLDYPYYLLHIDANSNVTNMYNANFQGLKLSTYPGKSKIYLNLQYSYAYIDVNHNIIEQGSPKNNTIHPGGNDLVYNSSLDGKNIGVFKNSQYVGIPQDQCSINLMQIDDAVKTLSKGIFYGMLWVDQSNPNNNLWKWHRDLFYIDYNNEYGVRLPTKNIYPEKVFELANGDVYLIGYTYEDKAKGLWKIILEE